MKYMKFEMYVTVAANIKAFKVRNAPHVVYAHKNRKDEVYIGQTQCVVNRWNEHNQIATSPSHPEYNQTFKAAIRANRDWYTYIVATADTPQEANDAEAAAIKFYNPSLNSHPGKSSNTENRYGFVLLNGEGREIRLEAKGKVAYRTQDRFTDKERSTIRCRTIRKTGKNYVSFESLADGFKVNISHEKRAEFKPGDVVLISYAAKGKTIYTTTDYSEITLA